MGPVVFMTNRPTVNVGLLAVIVTLVLVPSSAALIRDSFKSRQAIAVLRVPAAFEIRSSRILDPAMYDRHGSAEGGEEGLRLVSIVSSRGQADAVLRLWESVKAEPLIRQVGMSVFLSGIGEPLTHGNILGDVAVSSVKDPEEFSTRTGIRVLPFSLVVAGGDTVLAAGPGLPDVSFIRDAAERFAKDGSAAATRFRQVTLEISSGLAAIETLFPSSTAAR